ncbi:MAG: FAD-dependent oxidoreductase, partial [Candidatus Aminicenantes bacterium]|nr:FAD-dependent oxidoreductase [Candidatus Aminicenantes bacterium]
MSDYGLVVIGGGEAGITAALRASQLGAKACMINREPELGGGCVQTGTLPSKTLSNAAHFLENLKQGKRYGIPVVENARADYRTILESRHKTTMCELGVLAALIRKNAITTLTGTASFTGPRTIEVRLPDGKAMDAVPARFLIVGAGVIGCELAFIFRSLGSEVVIVEKAPRALVGQDHEAAALITREFKKRGIRLITGAGLERVEEAGQGRLRAIVTGGESIEADRVMIGVGRRPDT